MKRTVLALALAAAGLGGLAAPALASSPITADDNGKYVCVTVERTHDDLVYCVYVY